MSILTKKSKIKLRQNNVILIVKYKAFSVSFVANNKDFKSVIILSGQRKMAMISGILQILVHTQTKSNIIVLSALPSMDTDFKL